MGISFNVWFKKEIKGLGQLGEDNLAIEPSISLLDKLAKKAKVTPLSDLVSADPDEMAELFELDVADMPKEEWFDAKVGLKTVRALIQELDKTPDGVKNKSVILEDLKCLEEDLKKGEAAKVKFHFAVID